MNLSHRIRNGNTLRRVSTILFCAVLVLGTLWIPALFAQDSGPKVFPSPEDAMKALVGAAEARDPKMVLAILGPEGKDILSSGDAVADKADVDLFIANCKEKMEFVKDKDRAWVIIGNDNIPFAIPIVKKGDGWVFDSKAGKEEILNRRVGRNELDTIEVCEGYVEAQREYAITDRELDGIIQYAQKFFSDPGRRNGLYWDAAEDEGPSPMGFFAAEAADEGYRRKEGGQPTPFHGYYFKILKAQGKNAPGGAYNYVIHGHMVAGFALVAWPASYGNSGVMTFIVNQNGIVYEKNLGPKTAQIAKAMTRYNPDKTWRKAR